VGAAKLLLLSCAMETSWTQQPVHVEQMLGSLRDWHDVQHVFQTTFQALYDVAHAQSGVVREVERRLCEVRDGLSATISQKADVAEVKAVAAVADEARTVADLASQRIEEESQCAQEVQQNAVKEAQTLCNGLGDLRAAVERQRVDVQQWRTGFEAGLARFVVEFTGAAQTVQDECKAALHQEVECMQQEMAHLQGEVGRLSIALEEKATAVQLQEIVREAWQREEGHLASLKRLCESKVSTSDFATLAALAEGKVSMVDLETAVQHHVQRRMCALVSEQQLVTQREITSVVESVGNNARDKVRQCERGIEELARRQERVAAATEELTAVASSKLESADVEALISGALADWVRAAQRSADAVQAAMRQGRFVHEESRDSGLGRWRGPQQNTSQGTPLSHDRITALFADSQLLLSPSECGVGSSACLLDTAISHLAPAENEVPHPQGSEEQLRLVNRGLHNEGGHVRAARAAATAAGATRDSNVGCSSGASLPAPRRSRPKNNTATSALQGPRPVSRPRPSSATTLQGRTVDRSRPM